MDRMGVVFVLALVLAVVVLADLARHRGGEPDPDRASRVSHVCRVQHRRAGVIVILIALYTAWW